MLEDDYPYVARRQNVCRLAGETTKIDVAYFINPDEKSITDWLVNFGPVNIGIAVPPDMKPYKGGVYRPSDYDCKFRVETSYILLVDEEKLKNLFEKYYCSNFSTFNFAGKICSRCSAFTRSSSSATVRQRQAKSIGL